MEQGTKPKTVENHQEEEPGEICGVPMIMRKGFSESAGVF